MTVLLQISDPHFGTERAAVVEALVRFAHEQRPDVLLLSGDITQRATKAQFATARAFVDRLRVPAALVIPGNHDIPLFNLAARLFSPYGHYRRAFGDALEPQFENDDVLVLALNTTRWYRHEDGEVSATQIERVAQRFEGARAARGLDGARAAKGLDSARAAKGLDSARAAKGLDSARAAKGLDSARAAQWRIVVVHQPVAVTRDQDVTNLLHGREAAVRRWAAAGADLIVGGHIHLPFVLPLRERWPGLPRAMWAVQAGTAVSNRVRADAGNSVNVIRVGAAADAAAGAKIAPAAAAAVKIGHLADVAANIGDPAPAAGGAAGAARRCCVIERWDHAAAAQRFERAAVYRLEGTHVG